MSYQMIDLNFEIDLKKHNSFCNYMLVPQCIGKIGLINLVD